MKLIKFTLVPIALSILFSGLFAQETDKKKPEYGWQKQVVGNLNFTQNNFDNWSQGGDNSWSWQLDVNTKFINDQEKYNWSNTGKISYGKTKVGDDAGRKSADEIKLESVFTYKLGVYVNPYIAVTGQTQFTEGYDYSVSPRREISNFMDPGYFTESAGIGYEPVTYFKSRLGAALKETITSDSLTAALYGKGEKTRVEFGAESVTDFNIKLSENILFVSKLELFSNLKRFDEIDVNWDNLFTAKVSTYIGVSFNIKLFYDRDISKKRQLKETLAVGLTYAFM